MKVDNKSNNSAILKINELLDLQLPFDKDSKVDAEKLLFNIEGNLDSVLKKLEFAYRAKVNIDILNKTVNKVVAANSRYQFDISSEDDVVNLKLVDTKTKETFLEVSSDIEWDMKDVKIHIDDEVYNGRTSLAFIDIDNIKVIKGTEDQIDNAGMFIALDNAVYSRSDYDDEFPSVSDCTYRGKQVLDLDDMCNDTFERINQDYLNNIVESTSKEKKLEPSLA